MKIIPEMKNIPKDKHIPKGYPYPIETGISLRVRNYLREKEDLLSNKRNEKTKEVETND